jgi:hypothetical protein
MIKHSRKYIQTLHHCGPARNLSVSALSAKKAAVTKRIQDGIALTEFYETSEIISERLEVLRYLRGGCIPSPLAGCSKFGHAGEDDRAIRANEARPNALNRFLLHLDAHFFPHALENHVYGLDDSELRVCFAVDD